MTDLKLFFKKNTLEAGTDEAGRGCLAGPVVAAAVILPEGFHNPILNDSKKLSKKNRDLLKVIIEKEAISWGVGFVDNKKIDEINILKASFKAMNIAIAKLSPKPEYLLIDGNRFIPEHKIDFSCIVKGDSKYASIAAASILAKTYRDEFMEKIHNEFPVYNWKKNKGYPTAEHKAAIVKNNITVYHRKSFRLFDNKKQLHFKF